MLSGLLCTSRGPLARTPSVEVQFINCPNGLPASSRCCSSMKGRWLLAALKAGIIPIWFALQFC